MMTHVKKQFGFTIVEALVALVIMGFGMLSLAGLQGGLTRNVDVVKQRAEAVRLAQEKIESLRSFTGIASTMIAATASAPASVDTTASKNWDTLASGTDTVTTNAAFTRTWTLAGVSTDTFRPLTVTVAWTDRAGEAQSVSLATVLSKSDPRVSGYLTFPLPENTTLKRPLNRNLDIPIPAIDLGNGKSAVKFGNAGKYISFSNVSGDVVELCIPTLTTNPTTAQVIAALTSTSTSNCTTVKGYIVAGYVGRDSSVSTTDWNAVQSGLGIATGGVSRNAAPASDPGISCEFGDAVNQTTGATIADFKYYVCVIPLDNPSAGVDYTWSGTIRISGPSVWNTSGNKYFVCRYQYEPTNSVTNVNQRNIQPYVNVDRSIDQQNYLIATTAGNTDTAAPTCPSSMTVNLLSQGVLHQDCRSASNSAGYASSCPLQTTGTTYTVTYQANGGSGSVPADANSPYPPGSVVIVKTAGALTRTGYALTGWADGSGSSYAPNATFTINANTTLYAQWGVQNYTLSYDANGGTGTPPSDAVTQSGLPTTIATATTLSRSGYTFTNWNTAANGSGATYTPSGPITMTADTRLYAQWSLIGATFTVSYNANGGSGTAPVDATAYSGGNAVTVRAGTALTNGTSTFNGWNTDSGGSGTAYAAGATFTINANTTLYAQWRGTLSTPTPMWTGSNPMTLSFAVTNATGYLLSSCSTPNKNNLTVCPLAGSAPQSGSTISPAPGNRTTICYSIVATAANYNNSAPSAVKCIFYASAGGGTYEYQ